MREDGFCDREEAGLLNACVVDVNTAAQASLQLGCRSAGGKQPPGICSGSAGLQELPPGLRSALPRAAGLVAE